VAEIEAAANKLVCSLAKTGLGAQPYPLPTRTA
jgi:hypothetical protein